MSAPPPTEFVNVEGYYAPEDGGLVFGVEPTILACAFLVLLTVAILMYFLGLRRSGTGGERSDGAPAEIHAAVLKASLEAMSADSNQLRQSAQRLRDVIERLLGPIMVVSKGLGDPVKSLDTALKGKVKDDHGDHGHDHGHGHGGHGHGGHGHGGHGHGGHGQGGHGGHGEGHGRAPGGDHVVAPVADCVHKNGHAPCPPSCGPVSGGGGGSAAAASTIAIISLPLQPAPVVHPAPPAPSPPPPPPPKGEDKMRDMSHEEQTEALARAVRKFHDHWSSSGQRIRELEAVRAALTRRPPTHSAGGRVWDRR